jgi:hypothetical protein
MLGMASALSNIVAWIYPSIPVFPATCVPLESLESHVPFVLWSNASVPSDRYIFILLSVLFHPLWWESPMTLNQTHAILVSKSCPIAYNTTRNCKQCCTSYTTLCMIWLNVEPQHHWDDTHSIIFIIRLWFKKRVDCIADCIVDCIGLYLISVPEIYYLYFYMTLNPIALLYLPVLGINLLYFTIRYKWRQSVYII